MGARCLVHPELVTQNKPAQGGDKSQRSKQTRCLIPRCFLQQWRFGRGTLPDTQRKKLIFAQGEDADAVFYIKKGKVKVAVVSKDGKEAVIALLGPDEFVGEGCLIGQPEAVGDSVGNDRMRDDASVQNRDPAAPS